MARKRWFRRADLRPTCALCVCSSEPEAPERARAMSEPSALSESELIARGTNPFMEAWLRAANSFVAPPAMDEDALPRSEDELEEEPGAIEPFNRLDCSPVQFKMNKMNSFEQHAGWSRCSMKKRSWCFKPRECQKCSRRLSELRDKQERKRRDAHAIRWKLQHVDSP